MIDDGTYSTVEMTEASFKQSKWKEDEQEQHVYGNIHTSRSPASPGMLAIVKWVCLVAVAAAMVVFTISGTLFFLKNYTAPKSCPHMPRSSLSSSRQAALTDALDAEADALDAKPGALSTYTDALRTQTDALRTNTDVLRTQTDALRTITDALRTNTDTLRTQTDTILTKTDALSTKTNQLDLLVNASIDATKELRRQVELYMRGELRSTLGDESQFFDVFNSGFRIWRLAFRGSAGTGGEIYNAYANPQEEVDEGCRTIPSISSRSSEVPRCSHHYRNNDVFNTWGPNVDQVALVLYKGGHRVAYVIFDGRSSDVINWFHHDRVLTSTWRDLHASSSNYNYFSITGFVQQAPHKRRFYISKQHGGCPRDLGWLTVVDTPVGRRCPWEGDTPTPVFLYAKTDDVTNWTTGEVGEADDLLVFVKYFV